MFRKRKLCLLTLCVLGAFLLVITGFMNVLTNWENGRIKTLQNIFEEQVWEQFSNLPETYKIKRTDQDNITNLFLQNLQFAGKIGNLQQLWSDLNAAVSATKLYSNNGNLSLARKALKTARIIAADLDRRGTQLKLLLTLEGGQKVVFKPKWYEIDKVIEGAVYAGKDRFGSEILAFYLSAILDMPLVPIAIDRKINIKLEIIPVASPELLATSFLYKNRTCIWGKCFYCKKEDPICDDDEGLLNGAVIFNLKGELKSYRSPWQRTYKSNKKALWQIKSNYCKTVSDKLSKRRLYDLIDAAIFDFLIQNGDRHHYETLSDKVILLDNGKGLGNPHVHHLDILAPLYQCCILRKNTWLRLLSLSGGLLKDILKSMPGINTITTDKHLYAVEERLLIVYAAVEYCKNRVAE